MELRYGGNSPFSRKARIALIECGLLDRVTLINAPPTAPETDIASVNPMLKVPALTTDAGEALYDSPVICEYVDALAGGGKLIPPMGPARWRVLRRQAVGDGIIEAILFIRQMKAVPDGDPRPHPEVRQREKIDLALDMLERETAEMAAEGVTVGAIAAGCALGWLDYLYPDWSWRAARPALAQWYAAFAQRPSMAETAPVKRD